MEWKRQDKTGLAAEEIMATPHDHFNGEIRSLMMALDTHAVVTWTKVPKVWEWWKRVDGTWRRKRAFFSAAEAKHHAEVDEDESRVLKQARALPEGTTLVVTAEWREPYHGSAPFDTTCQTPGTAEAIAGIFKRMGCTVTTQVA